ncbi:nitroreductase family deazaflavin-dependent oxidoreductase [Nocardia brasiliensis]
MTQADRGPQFFPTWFGRWQSRYMNPVARRLSRYLPTFAVIEHRGRKSGKRYETPVNTFGFDGGLGIVLGHGTTDWARNVLAAGEAELRRRGRAIRLVNPRIVDSATVAPLPLVPRMETGLVHAITGKRLQLFVADIAPS